MDHATCPALEMEQTPYRIRTAPLSSRCIAALDDAPGLDTATLDLALALKAVRPNVVAFGGERNAWRGALDAWRDSVNAVAVALAEVRTDREFSADLFRYRANW